MGPRAARGVELGLDGRELLRGRGIGDAAAAHLRASDWVVAPALRVGLARVDARGVGLFEACSHHLAALTRRGALPASDGDQEEDEESGEKRSTHALMLASPRTIALGLSAKLEAWSWIARSPAAGYRPARVMAFSGHATTQSPHARHAWSLGV